MKVPMQLNKAMKNPWQDSIADKIAYQIAVKNPQQDSIADSNELEAFGRSGTPTTRTEDLCQPNAIAGEID